MDKYLLVKQARLELGMNQTQFGEMLNVGLQEVSKWERNIISIPKPRLALLLFFYLRKTNGGRLEKDFITNLLR